MEGAAVLMLSGVEKLRHFLSEVVRFELSLDLKNRVSLTGRPVLLL